MKLVHSRDVEIELVIDENMPSNMFVMANNNQVVVIKGDKSTVFGRDEFDRIVQDAYEMAISKWKKEES